MIVVVTGLMRSGTSLVARQLHQMGVPMGTLMRFPLMTEVSQIDWEDADFTEAMLMAFLGYLNHGELRAFIREYIEDRQRSAVWGVKSPFLLPFVDMFKQEADDEVKVILTRRVIPETFESIERQTSLEGVKELQRKLIPALNKVQPDLVIDIEESWESPETVKSKLHNLIRSN